MSILLGVHDSLTWTLRQAWDLMFPRQEFINAVDGMVAMRVSTFAQMGLGMEIVQFRRSDRALSGGGAFSARI